MLIGLHGKKSAGKDTVYERLALKLDAKVERVSFADLLYESAAASLGVTVEELRVWKNDPDAGVVVIKNGTPRMRRTVRSYLQAYGTEAHRDVFGDNFWVERANLRDHEGRIVVVTDVRFRNEAQAVLDAGGALVHVVGPLAVEYDGDGHASEETLPGSLIDAVLVNDVRDDDFRSLDSEVLGTFLQLRREGY